MISPLLQVALGGALGASARFMLGGAIARAMVPGFPVAILGINVLGSFLMGLFVVAAHHRGFGAVTPLVATGLLGGFTTFSAFSLEAYTLVERGHLGQAALYVGLSVALSLAGLALGVWLARSLWA